MHALRKTSRASVAQISSNLVYEHPTVASLARYVSQIVTVGLGGAEASRTAADLTAFLARYTADFPKHIPSKPVPKQDVVLVTGTTGALGTALLARLVETNTVARVYAFNRPSRQYVQLLKRQQAALKERGYSPDIALSAKVVLIEGELTSSGLGVDKSLEDEIRESVTHIIHNGKYDGLIRGFCADAAKQLGESTSTFRLTLSRQQLRVFGRL